MTGLEMFFDLPVNKQSSVVVFYAGLSTPPHVGKGGRPPLLKVLPSFVT